MFLADNLEKDSKFLQKNLSKSDKLSSTKNNSSLKKVVNNEAQQKQHLHNAERELKNQQQKQNFPFGTGMILRNTNNRETYYIPPGGWPPRTRTGPDGRRLILSAKPLSSLRDSKLVANNKNIKNINSYEDEYNNENKEENHEREEEEEEGDEEPEEEKEEKSNVYNQNREELKSGIDNEEKIKLLWKDLGSVIDKKPWQNPTTKTLPNTISTNIKRQLFSQTTPSTINSISIKETTNSNFVTVLKPTTTTSKIWIPYEKLKENLLNSYTTSTKNNLLTPRTTTIQPKFSTIKKTTTTKDYSTKNPFNSVIHFTFVGS